ncbi:MAG: GNAT family N-acetyltransferase [Planctomycetes bacterium]|nr:GNAT family N-acetyltransferase [Planctomycetota bacterium]
MVERPESGSDRETTDCGTDEVAQWFGIPSEDELRGTFPQVYHPGGRGQRLVVRRLGNSVAHAATIDVVWVENDREFRVVLVGTVATAPGHRGEGLASGLLRGIIGRAETSGCDAVVLWSGPSEPTGLYARLGFVPTGLELSAPIRGRAHPELAGQVRPLLRDDVPALLALHRRKPMRIERSRADLEVMLTAKPMLTTVLDVDGEVRAYACLRKGADFPDWWHELGGTDREVLGLVESTMYAAGMESASVLLPPYRRELRAALGERATRRPAALCRPVTTTLPRLFVDGLDSI